MPATETSIEQAMAWIVGEVGRLLSDDAALGPLVEKLVHETVHGARSIVEHDITPWDHSLRGVRTNQPYDLAAYETFADFLKEPTGNTVATYCSGAGFAAETWEDVIGREVAEIVGEAVRSVTRKGIESGPDTVREILQKWMNKEKRVWIRVCASCFPMLAYPLIITTDCF